MDEELLSSLYDNQPYSVDNMAHTDEEEALVNTYNAMKASNFSKREIFVKLLAMRKASRLKPKGRKNAVDSSREGSIHSS